jgi:hypothetical protein
VHGQSKEQIAADKERAKAMAPLPRSSRGRRPAKYDLFAELLTSVANDQKLKVGSLDSTFSKPSCVRLEAVVSLLALPDSISPASPILETICERDVYTGRQCVPYKTSHSPLQAHADLVRRGLHCNGPE